MDDIHRQVLQTKLTYLQDQLESRKVLDILFEKQVLERDDIQRLQAEVVDSCRVRQLLIFILPLRGPQAYMTFIEALDKIGQKHIKETLLKEEKQLQQKKIEDGR